MSDSKSDSNTKAPFYKKWWFWVIIVVVVIAIGGGAASGDKEAKKIGEDGTAEVSSADKTFKVGDKIAVDGMEITVTSVERNWTPEYGKADEGKEYVRVSLQINNTSNETKSYNGLDWKVEDGDGAIESYAGVMGNKDELNSGELAAGGSKKGSLVFKVPKDDKSLKLHYRTNIFSDKDLAVIELQ